MSLFSLSRAVKSDLAGLEESRANRERFKLEGRVFHLHAPEGIARSKLFARVERSLGVICTARNWRTAVDLLDLGQQVAGNGA